MKIEKLTDNKIRIIMNMQDIEKNTNDIHTFFDNIMNSQNLFLDILQKAEKEVDFHTEGCKLLIEAFSTLEDVVVFTITKYSSTENSSINTGNVLNNTSKRKLIVKRKTNTPSLKNAVYEFDNFDYFCDFCNSISKIENLNIDKLAKKIVLYNYQDKFFLIFKDINFNNTYVHKVFNILLEFSKFQNFSANFEYKLAEHAKIYIKNNAISKGIKYFV